MAYYVCNKCNDKCADERTLVSHLEIHNGKSVSTAKCGQCDVFFLNQTTLLQHYEEDHLPKKRPITPAQDVELEKMKAQLKLDQEKTKQINLHSEHEQKTMALQAKAEEMQYEHEKSKMAHQMELAQMKQNMEAMQREHEEKRMTQHKSLAQMKQNTEEKKMAQQLELEQTKRKTEEKQLEHEEKKMAKQLELEQMKQNRKERQYKHDEKTMEQQVQLEQVKQKQKGQELQTQLMSQAMKNRHELKTQLVDKYSKPEVCTETTSYSSWWSTSSITQRRERLPDLTDVLNMVERGMLEAAPNVRPVLSFTNN